MLPLPSNLNLYFFNSSGQFFSALLSFLRLFGGPGAFGCFRGSCFFGGCCVVVLGEVDGNGRTNRVTRGSVVSFLNSSLRAGTSFGGFSDPVHCCARIVHNSLSALITCSTFTIAKPLGTSRVRDCIPLYPIFMMIPVQQPALVQGDSASL